MSHRSNVVRLHSTEAGQGQIGQVNLPAPLAKLRIRCGTHIKKLMQRFFDRIDDTFFDLADRALNNSEQSSYLDAMREIRIKKSIISEAFLSAYYRDFSFAVADESHGVAVVCDPQNLAIVANEELEEQVAIDNIVKRIKNEVGLELEHLTRRFDALLPTINLLEDSNPVGAYRLAHNFADSCAAVELDIRSKLVLYKIFEQQVLSQVKSMVSVANKFLIEQGVLPGLDGARRAPGGYSGPEHGNSLAGHEKAREVFGDSDYERQQVRNASYWQGCELNSLLVMNELQRHMPSFDPQGVATSLPLLRQPGLVRALSVAQNAYVDSGEGQHSAVPVNNAGLIDFVSLMQRMMQGDDGRPRARIDREDQNAIHLVTMLFDFILEDRQLQAPIKALLGRLQIPLVKVALMDKSFFSKGGHVARKLVNELALASVGWTENVDGADDAFFSKLEVIVNRVVNEFKDDVSIFTSALAEFQQFQQAEKKRRVLLEQRIKDSEEGRAKTDAAKRDVQNTLNQLLEGFAVSDFIVDVLREGWSSYMVLLNLKHGSDHPGFEEAKQTAEDLIKATSVDGNCQPLSALETEQLLSRLKEGLAQTACQGYELDRVLDDITECCSAADPNSRNSDSSSNSSDAGITLSNDIIDSPQICAEEKNSDDTTAIVSDLSVTSQDHASTDSTTDNNHPDFTQHPKIVLLTEEVEETPQAIDPGFLALVERLGIGSWVEMHETEDKSYRCKLAAIIKSCDKYIFVNRMGVKVAEKSKAILAKQVSEKSVRLLDDGLLFDRALESVITTLRT